MKGTWNAVYRCAYAVPWAGLSVTHNPCPCKVSQLFALMNGVLGSCSLLNPSSCPQVGSTAWEYFIVVAGQLAVSRRETYIEELRVDSASFVSGGNTMCPSPRCMKLRTRMHAPSLVLGVSTVLVSTRSDLKYLRLFFPSLAGLSFRGRLFRSRSNA